MSNSIYNSIEKITSQVFVLNSEFTLKHCVKVAHKRSDGIRELFHSEYTYISQTSYRDTKYLKSIKLNFSSYLLLEETNTDKDWSLKESVFINSANIFKLVKVLKKVKKWFYKYDDLYYYDDHNELKINGEVVKNCNISLKLMDKIIIIQPTIIYKNDVGYEGVNMYINKSSCICPLTIDKLEALYYILKKFNLYEAGLSLINYLGRPPEEMYNRDIGIESKTDLNNFYKKHESSKGMQKMYDVMKQEEKKKNEFFDYFK